MKRIYILEVEEDEQETKIWEAKRKAAHLLKRSVDDHVDILVSDALKSKQFPQAKVRPAPDGAFRDSGDPDGSL